MVICFQPGGKLVTRTKIGLIESEKTGSWRERPGDSTGDSTMIACTLDGQASDVDVQWIDSDTIRLTPPNLAGLSIKLVFRRQH